MQLYFFVVFVDLDIRSTWKWLTAICFSVTIIALHLQWKLAVLLSLVIQLLVATSTSADKNIMSSLLN